MQASGNAGSATPRNPRRAHGEAPRESCLVAWRELEQANWSKAKGAARRKLDPFCFSLSLALIAVPEVPTVPRIPGL